MKTKNPNTRLAVAEKLPRDIWVAGFFSALSNDYFSFFLGSCFQHFKGNS